MKNKKHAGDLTGVQILHVLIHRHRHRHRHSLHHLLATVSSCILLLLAVMSFLAPSIHNHFTTKASVHMKVQKEIVFRVPMKGRSIDRELWWSSNQSNFYHGCSNASVNFPTAEVNTKPNRYLLISTSGGLNQQSTGITDAVVAAYILNATLVIPKMDRNSFWNDSSNFSEIFDVNWFISYLSKDVKIIEQLPGNVGRVVTTTAPIKCNEECYWTSILPIFKLERVQAVELTDFKFRLSNKLDMDLQKLRCRANYHALRFTDPILEMGHKLVERMRKKSKHFVALHLRFEPDMLAFSGCYYGGGEKEITELGELRKRWRSLPVKDPETERRLGRCMLSPEEVGLMLRALGFGYDVHIYVASGEVYGGDDMLAPLKALFPNLHTKRNIATDEELAPFLPYASRMAALDFIVSEQSYVFVANNNGNMAKVLTGRRRYFGHKPTIRPNTEKLYRLFLDRNSMTWKEFASQVRNFQVGFMGEPNEVGPGKSEFRENPRACICEDSEARAVGDSAYQRNDIVKSIERSNEVFSGDEQDMLVS